MTYVGAVAAAEVVAAVQAVAAAVEAVAVVVVALEAVAVVEAVAVAPVWAAGAHAARRLADEKPEITANHIPEVSEAHRIRCSMMYGSACLFSPGQ